MPHFVLIPVPYEATTTFGKGTKNGPRAILKAMDQVEEYDHELGFDVTKRAQVKTFRPIGIRPLGKKVGKVLGGGKIPIILGGEHSITPQAVQAVKDKYPDLSVLQLDAHADLRDSYQGRKDSHACVMRRVLEICPAVQAGIRSLSEEEHEFAKRTGQDKKMFFRGSDNQGIVSLLSKDVYLTIDVDVFDPACVRAVGTPEPDGLSWREVLDILIPVCRTRNVVGLDIVELSPRPGDLASDFTVARLVRKIIALLSAK